MDTHSNHEKAIESTVCNTARKHGWLVRKFASPGRRGVPDRLFMRNGVSLFIEFKATGKRASHQQKTEHNNIRRAGIEVYVIDSIEEGRALFVHLDDPSGDPLKYLN